MSRAWLWGAVGLAIVLAPLGVVAIPPLLDYPSHLARMRILAEAGSDPVLAQIYVTDWAVLPNLAMDLVVPPLARVIGLEAAGRVFLALSMAIPVLGAVALNRAWHGGTSLWPWIALLTATNGFVAMGFLNFVFSVGVALLATAAVVRGLDRGLLPALVMAALGGCVAILSHIFGVALLGLLIGCQAAAALLRGRWRPMLAGALAAFVAVAVPLGLYVLLGPQNDYVAALGVDGALEAMQADWTRAELLRRWVWLASPFVTPGNWLTLPSIAAIAAVLGFALLGGRVRLALPGVLAALALLVAYFTLPSYLVDTAVLYNRMALPLALIGIAAVDLAPRTAPAWRRALIAAGLAAALLVPARAGVTAWLWARWDATIADTRAVLAELPRGARLAAVRDGSDAWHLEPGEPRERAILANTVGYVHVPSLAIIDRSAFWPLMFALTGKQPIRVLPPYDRLAQTNGGILPLTSDLAAPHELTPHLHDWASDYDYVLRLNAPTDAQPPDPRLTQVAAQGWAVLYRIMR